MAEERIFKADLRRFETDIGTILITFEKAREWADLTSCLNRLHKCIARAPSTVNTIPMSDVVAKRLGQCLNPTLPAGVHSKCLEVYTAIFERIGVEGLSNDLGLWTPGLFPIFETAATHIKPLFLHLLDTYYIPLGSRLMPCLTGLLVCLLPGLDVTGDHGPLQVMNTLRAVAHKCVGEAAFFQALWIVMLRTSRVRLPALQVLMAFIPIGSLSDLDDEKMRIYLPDRDTLVMRALDRLFSDNDILVQRQLLDFLVPQLPFDSQCFSTQQKVKLLRGSFQVMSVGEWSLTRRFLHWITGQADILDGIELGYFQTYVCEALCTALEQQLLISQQVHSKDHIVLPLKVLRVISSEADELSPLLLRCLTVPLLAYITESDTYSRPLILETVRTIILTNSSTIAAAWDALNEHVEIRLKNVADNQILQALQLSILLLDDIVCHSDGLSTTVVASISSLSSVMHLQRITAQALRGINAIVSLRDSGIDPHYFLELLLLTSHCLKRLNEDLQPAACTAQFNEATNNFLSFIEHHIDALEAYGEGPTESSENVCGILSHLLIYIWKLNFEHIKLNNQIKESLPIWCTILANQAVAQSHQVGQWNATRIFLSLLSEITVLRHYYVQEGSDGRTDFTNIAAGFWSVLLIDTKNNIGSSISTQAALLLLELDRIELQETGAKETTIIKTLLITELSHHLYETRLSGFRKFSLLWQYSHMLHPQRHVFPGAMRLVLDCLEATEPSLRYVCRSWLSLACQKYLSHVLDPLLEELLANDTYRTGGKPREYIQFYDTARTVYVLSRLTSIIRAEPKPLIHAMHNHVVSEQLLRSNWNHSWIGCSSEDDSYSLLSQQYIELTKHIDEIHKNKQVAVSEDNVELREHLWIGYADDRIVIDYLDLCCVIALRFIQTEVSHTASPEFSAVNLIVQSASAEFLRVFLEACDTILPLDRCSEIHRLLAGPLIDVFSLASINHNSTIQIQLLDILRLIIPFILKNSHFETSPATTDAMVSQQNLPLFIINQIECQKSQQLITLLTIGWSCKTKQISHLPSSLGDGSYDVLNIILFVIKSTGGSSTRWLEESFSATLSSFIDFVLFVIPLFPEIHPELNKLYQLLLQQFTTCLQSDNCRSLASLYLLRGLSSYIDFLSCSCLSDTQLRNQALTDNSIWGKTFFFNWHTSNPPRIQRLGSQTDQIKLTVLTSFLPSILTSLACATKWHTKECFPDCNISEHTPLLSTPLIKIDNLISSELNLHFKNEDFIQLEIDRILIVLLERCPYEFVMSLLMVSSFSPSLSSKIITALTDCRSISIGDILTPLIHTIYIMTAESIPTTIPQQRSDMILGSGFIPRETLLLGQIYSLLDAAGIRLKHDIQTVWNHLFELLHLVVTHSSEPLAFIWMVSILQLVDLQFPSKESTISGSSHTLKKVRRGLSELSRFLALISAQQFHLYRMSTIDLTTPYPPPATHLLSQISLSNPPPTDNDTHDNQILSSQIPDIKDDSIAYVSQLALAALIQINRQVTQTQKRTVISAAIVVHISEDHWKTILSATMRNISINTLQYRYLGFLYVQTLPHSLVPSSLSPCKRLLIDFVGAPAFGGSSTLFSQISPYISNGVQLFQGLDRRSFRALGTAIRIAAESDPESPMALGDTLTMSKSAGVFTTKEMDLYKRARELKRLSFILLACTKDFFQLRLTAVAGRIVECLRLESTGTTCIIPSQQLHLHAFLCLRVLFFRSSPHFLASLWPIVLTELTRIFSLPLIPQHLPLFLAVLKVVDLAILLDLPDFHLYQWIFTADAPALNVDITIPETTTNRCTQDVVDNKHKKFQSLCARLGNIENRQSSLSKNMSIEDEKDATRETTGRLRRPLVTEYEITQLEDLTYIAERLNRAALTESIGAVDIDSEAVLRSIENDMLECPLEIRDWGKEMKLV